MFALAQQQNVIATQHLHWSQTRVIKLAHGLLVYSAYVMQCFHGCMDSGKSIAEVALGFTLARPGYPLLDHTTI